jgi:hypothetical protein
MDNSGRRRQAGVGWQASVAEYQYEGGFYIGEPTADEGFNRGQDHLDMNTSYQQNLGKFMVCHCKEPI